MVHVGAPPPARCASIAAALRDPSFKDHVIYIDALMRDLELTLQPGEMPGKRSVLRFLFDDAIPHNRW